jgi:ribosome maturation protein Sdo1
LIFIEHTYTQQRIQEALDEARLHVEKNKVKATNGREFNKDPSRALLTYF